VLSDSTLGTALPILSVILDYAVERGLLTTNPMRGGEPLWRASLAAEAVDPFTPAELRKILAAARAIDSDFAALIQVMMQTSLRPGEGLGLRRCDIDLGAAMINVNGTWSRGALGPTKNRHSTRRVSMLYPTTEDRGCVAPSGCRSRNAAGAGRPPRAPGGAGGSRGPALHLQRDRVQPALAPRDREGGCSVPEAPCPSALVRLDPPEPWRESPGHPEGRRLAVGDGAPRDLREVDRGGRGGPDSKQRCNQRASC
jgi:hypothetical protein